MAKGPRVSTLPDPFNPSPSHRSLLLRGHCLKLGQDLVALLEHALNVSQVPASRLFHDPRDVLCERLCFALVRVALSNDLFQLGLELGRLGLKLLLCLFALNFECGHCALLLGLYFSRCSRSSLSRHRRGLDSCRVFRS